MILRIMLSLKKAADLSQISWSLLQEMANSNTPQSILMSNPPPCNGTVRKQETVIPLDVFRQSGTAIQGEVLQMTAV